MYNVNGYVILSSYTYSHSPPKPPPPQYPHDIQVFVARNIANLVVNTDMSLLAVLEYAVHVLEVGGCIFIYV